jgi:hypothetical protein
MNLNFLFFGDTMSNQKKTSIRRGGPRTAEGKRRSSRNARKHALLTTELNLSTEERSEFDDVKKGLLQELMPNTPILQLLFEIVVADAWRMKLAFRGEQRAVKKQLDLGDDPQPLSKKVRMDFPYVLSASDLRPRLELLENTQTAFAQTGCLNPDLEDPFTRAFGIEFWKTLIDWQPLNTTMVGLLEAAVEKQKAFAMKPLEDPPTAEQERLYMEYDTKSRNELVLKLMDWMNCYSPSIVWGRRMRAEGQYQRRRTDGTFIFAIRPRPGANSTEHSTSTVRRRLNRVKRLLRSRIIAPGFQPGRACQPSDARNLHRDIGLAAGSEIPADETCWTKMVRGFSAGHSCVPVRRWDSMLFGNG